MKIGQYLSLVLVALILALPACSLAEDITPPPGYESTTVLTASQTISTEPVPASTDIPAASSTIARTNADVSSSLTISGKAVNASGEALNDPLTAHLYLYDNSAGTVSNTFISNVDATGSYIFEAVPANTNLTYFVMVEYQGVTYSSDPISYDGSSRVKDIPIILYDTTDDLTSLTLLQVHLQYDFSTDGKAQAQMLYIVNNMGQKSVVVRSDGTSIPFIEIPSGAADVQYEVTQGGAALSTAVNGFALLPGTDKQYGIIAKFSFPYIKSLEVNQPFTLPVSSETIIVPEGVKVTSPQLKDTGLQSFQGINYHLYQGSNLASGSTLTYEISGKPGDVASPSTNNRLIILIVVGAVGILLVGVGLFLILRDRFKRKTNTVDALDTGGSNKQNQDSILDTIIALDEQYKEGRISRDAYSKRRDELKGLLRELIRPS
jgi:hypothetical protein